MTPNLHAIVVEDTAVQAALARGNDIAFYRDEAPDGTTGTYCRWFTVFGDSYNSLADVPDMDSTRVQFDVFAQTQNLADNAFFALRNVFEEGMHGHLVGYATDRDPDTKRYRVMFEFSFKNPR